MRRKGEEWEEKAKNEKERGDHIRDWWWSKVKNIWLIKLFSLVYVLLERDVYRVHRTPRSPGNSNLEGAQQPTTTYRRRPEIYITKLHMVDENINESN